MSTIEFQMIPFTELLTKIVDNRGKTCPTSTSGIPLIATNCITNDTLYPVYEKVRYVSEETLDTWFRGHPEPDDIIITTKGTPGRVCMVPNPVDFCIAQDMVAVRADKTKIEPRYLFAILRSRNVQTQIENMHVGTLIPHFKKGDFDKLLIPVPNLAIQRLIGDQYFSQSAKIELNRRMNATLEAMARALFKSWFVDFDPVRAKMEGRQPAGMDAATAALFPDSFEDSPLGTIPKGWQAGKFGDIASPKRDGIKPTDISPTTPYIGLEHMPRCSISLTDWGNASDVASGKSSFSTGDFLFGKLRPYFHKVGVAPVDGVCSTDIVVVTPKKPEWYGITLCYLSSDEFVQYTDQSSSGTKMPRTNWQDMARYGIVIPPAALAQEFHRLIGPFISAIQADIHQSRNLIAIRDTLLPKLLSGEFATNADNA